MSRLTTTLRISLIASILVGCLILIAPDHSKTTASSAVEPPSNELKFFFGNLHAHSSYSDGTGTPAEAFKYARDVAKLDFLAVTEHNHKAAEGTGDDPLKLHIAKDPTLYTKLIQDANAANKDDQFVAIFGQEFSTIKKGGNHTNSFMTKKRITTQNGDYKTVFTTTWMEEFGVSSIQFNHPWEAGVSASEIGTPQDVNYGFNKYQNKAAFVKAVSDKVVTIEVVNGPGTKNPSPGEILNSKADPSYYLRYLNMGLHIAPTADQDNHFRTWGTLTTARTVILAPRLTRTSLLNALKEHRVYATQDNDLKITFKLNDEVMGSKLSALASGESASLSIGIDDGGPSTNTYRVNVYYDNRPGFGLAKIVSQKTLTNHQTLSLNHSPVSGKGYYFLEIEITKGHNIGKRAWTAPIWLE